MLLMKDVIPLKLKANAEESKRRKHEYSLFYGLHKLFLMIDVNCDGNLSWDEFSSYLINSYDNIDTRN